MRKPTKKLLETVDITPTWESLVPVMIAAFESGGKASAAMRLELVRMARAADAYNQHVRHGRIPGRVQK